MQTPRQAITASDLKYGRNGIRFHGILPATSPFSIIITAFTKRLLQNYVCGVNETVRRIRTV